MLVLEAARHDRRRHAYGRAHPAGLPARRLLGHPPAGRSPRRSSGASAREHGLEFAHPEIPLAHPLDDGTAAALHRSVDETAAGLGDDEDAYRTLMRPLAATGRRWSRTCSARCDCRAIRSPSRASPGPACARRRGLARARFAGVRARHCSRAMPRTRCGRSRAARRPASACADAARPRRRLAGGRRRLQAITDAMASLLRSLGGEIETGREVRSLRDVARARAVLFDLGPRQILAIAGDELPPRTARARALPLRPRRLQARLRARRAGARGRRRSAGGPARAPRRHARGGRARGGTRSRAAGCRRPFVLVAQQSLFDPTPRARGEHTLWAYCHVPNGSTIDARDAIESQIERFAPGFRDSSARGSAYGPGRAAGATTRTTSAATSTAARRPAPALDAPGRRRCRTRRPTLALHVLVLDTARRRRSRMCGWHAARAALRGVLR